MEEWQFDFAQLKATFSWRHENEHNVDNYSKMMKHFSDSHHRSNMHKYFHCHSNYYYYQQLSTCSFISSFISIFSRRFQFAAAMKAKTVKRWFLHYTASKQTSTRTFAFSTQFSVHRALVCVFQFDEWLLFWLVAAFSHSFSHFLFCFFDCVREIKTTAHTNAT